MPAQNGISLRLRTSALSAGGGIDVQPKFNAEFGWGPKGRGSDLAAPDRPTEAGETPR